MKNSKTTIRILDRFVQTISKLNGNVLISRTISTFHYFNTKKMNLAVLMTKAKLLTVGLKTDDKMINENNKVIKKHNEIIN